MGVPPVQIHVMSAISGVEWDEAWSDRVAGRLGSHSVQFLGRGTFLRNKRAAGRPRILPTSMRSSPVATSSGDARTRFDSA